MRRPRGSRRRIPTYEWLPSRFALLHIVDARVGEEHIEGAEIIGCPALGAYVTRYFGNDGPNAYEASVVEVDGALVWTMRSAAHRVTGTFSDDGNSISGHWERLDDEKAWKSWMDVTLTRDPS
jgi:hypothetical protein